MLDPSVGLLRMDRRSRRQPALLFMRADGDPLTFAGLWDEWKDRATGEKLKSCTMIINEPNDFVADVHDRLAATDQGHTALRPGEQHGLDPRAYQDG